MDIFNISINSKKHSYNTCFYHPQKFPSAFFVIRPCFCPPYHLGSTERHSVTIDLSELSESTDYAYLTFLTQSNDFEIHSHCHIHQHPILFYCWQVFLWTIFFIIDVLVESWILSGVWLLCEWYWFLIFLGKYLKDEQLVYMTIIYLNS